MSEVFVGMSLACAAAMAGLRAVHRNRHVRGRLATSALAFVGAAIVGAVLTTHRLSREFEDSIRLVAPLLLAFGAVNALVALVINPWRVDRLPDRFPTIVQDAIVIALFALAATAVLQEKVFATTAVGAVVVGFALQDTLGNLFAGLAIQIEKPFRVGHWVRISGTDALVDEITWRATKLRTKAGNFLIVPNSVVARDAVLNYSEPVAETRLEIEVGASYDAPPNRVKAVILAAIRHEPLVARTRPPEVLVVDFGASAVVYRIRVWTSEFGADEVLRDRVRTAVYYAFRRAAIEIPYPVQVQIERDETRSPSLDSEAVRAALGLVSIFAALTEEQRASLAGSAHLGLYAANDVIVRQGDAGSSMFVLVSGEAVVVLEPGDREVARVNPGGFFGEMSLLTGDPRTATVRTTSDAELLEITADDFRRFVLANPAAVDLVGEAAARRRAELLAHASEGQTSALEPPHGFMARVRRFLRLTPS